MWIYMSKQAEGDGFVLKLTDEKPDWRGIFFFDKKTDSVRLQADPKYVLSNASHSNKKGKNVIMEAT